MTRDNLLTIAPYILWALLWAVMAAYFPALEVDETRYLTVAWEMLIRGDYILPTLNFEPYHHKPPLLFWLINLSWSVFGYNVWAARLVPGIVMLGILWATRRLAATLWPDRAEVALYAPFVVLLSPIMLGYGGLIMFDTMMTLIVTIALLLVWSLAQNFSWVRVAGLAALFALGGVAKGPMVLVYVLPALLLASFWTVPATRRGTWARWYGAALLAVIFGIAGALAWAIPAAIKGGPEYAHMIFWGQSAGRVVQSFAHQKPLWFYIPILLAYIAPLLFWPTTWRSLRAAWVARDFDLSMRFLGLSAIMPFIIFTLISGKQVHYLMPFFPAIALMMTAVILQYGPRFPASIGGVSVIPLVILGGGLILSLLAYAGLLRFGSESVMALLQTQSMVLLIVGIAAAIFVVRFAALQSVGMRLVCIAGLLLLTLGVFHLQFAAGAYRYFDLRPLAAELQKYPDHLVGYRPYNKGQLGFLAHSPKPIDSVTHATQEDWFQKNPEGLLVIRVKDLDDDIYPHRLLYAQPYRSRSYMAIISR